jgi:dienelactone hydrolase
LWYPRLFQCRARDHTIRTKPSVRTRIQGSRVWSRQPKPLKPDSVVDFFGSQIPGSYFLDFLNYDPAKVAAGLKVPILVLQGGRDYQVTTADFDIWKQALANDPRATFKFYPAYTHLFMPGAGSGPATPEDYSVAGNVSEDVINDIVHWIKSNAAAH